MVKELDLEFTGLYTDPNPYSGRVPPGALRTAQNTRSRRRGVLEPRPGFKDAIAGAWSPIGTNEARKLIPYDGEVLIIREDASNNWSTRVLSDGDIIGAASGNNTPQSYTPLFVEQGIEYPNSYAYMRGNLYVSGKGGVRKLCAGTDSNWKIAGVQKAGSGVWSIPGASDAPWLDGAAAVAYRVVYRKEDANGVIVRSAPSGRMVVYQTSGDASSEVNLTIPVPDGGLEAGDVLEVYRSLVSKDLGAESVPSDELQLAFEYTLTATDLVNEFVTITDQTPEARLGRTIYTAPSIGGQPYYPPPGCGVLAAFKGSLFFGAVYQNVSIQLELIRTDKNDKDGEGWGFRPNSTEGITCDVNTSTAVTNIAPDTSTWDADLSNLDPYITEAGTGINTNGTYIPKETSIEVTAATTGTLSNAATGTTTGLAVDIWEVLSFGSDKIYGGDALDLTGAKFTFNAYFDASGPIDPRESIEQMAYLVNRESQGSTGLFVGSSLGAKRDAGKLLLESMWAAAACNLTVGISHAKGWAPDTSQSASTTETVPLHKNRIMWSEPNEPEHVPLTNYVDVGREDKWILAMVPAGDGLYIFKQDGLWRLTGAGATSGWRLDEIDQGVRLLHPECAAYLGGAIYAWTNHGVIAIRGSDWVPISDPAIGNELRELERTFSQYPVALRGAWLVANDTSKEILLSVPNATAQDAGDQVYCFSTATGTWHKWDIAARHACYSPEDGKVYFAEGSSNMDVRVERAAGDDTDAADLQTSITISDVTNNTITLSGAWSTVAVGDAIKQGATIAIIDSVASTTEFTVTDATGITAAAATGYSAFTCIVEPLAKAAQDASAVKMYREGAWIFDTAKGIYEVTIGHDSDSDQADGSYNLEFTSKETTDRVLPVRFHVPRNHARVAVLWPKLTITQACAPWRLSQLRLTFQPVSDRVRRSY